MPRPGTLTNSTDWRAIIRWSGYILAALLAIGASIAIGISGASEFSDFAVDYLGASVSLANILALSFGGTSVFAIGAILFRALRDEINAWRKKHKKQQDEPELAPEPPSNHWLMRLLRSNFGRFSALFLSLSNTLIETSAMVSGLEDALTGFIHIPGCGFYIRIVTLIIGSILAPLQIAFAYNEIKEMFGFSDTCSLSPRVNQYLYIMGIMSANLFGLATGTAGGATFGMLVAGLLAGVIGGAASMGIGYGLFAVIGFATFVASSLSTSVTVKEMSGLGYQATGFLNGFKNCYKRYRNMRRGGEIFAMLNGLGEGMGLYDTMSDSLLIRTVFKIPTLEVAISGAVLVTLAFWVITRGFFRRFFADEAPTPAASTKDATVDKGEDEPFINLYSSSSSLGAPRQKLQTSPHTSPEISPHTSPRNTNGSGSGKVFAGEAYQRNGSFGEKNNGRGNEVGDVPSSAAQTATITTPSALSIKPTYK